MSEVQPQPGDKVRVTIEATVTRSGGYLGRSYVDKGDATVEILERADDPRRDPIGTVRQEKSQTDGVTFLPIVKMDSNKWHVVGNPGQEYDDSYVARYTVTGAVPGTPAAEAQYLSSPSIASEYAESVASGYDVATGECMPLVVQYGDPEPNQDTVWRDQTGRTIGYRHNGWGQSVFYPWSDLAEHRFPMTKVVEP